MIRPSDLIKATGFLLLSSMSYKFINGHFSFSADKTESCSQFGCITEMQLYNEVKQDAAITDEPSSFIPPATGELSRTDIIVRTIRRQYTTVGLIIDGHLSEILEKIYWCQDFILHQGSEMIILTTKDNLSVLK